MENKVKKIFATAAVMTLFGSLSCQAADILGRVVDSKTNEALIGATIQVDGTNTAAVTDVDGHFELKGLAAGKYSLIVKYVAYNDQILENVEASDTPQEITVELASDDQVLGEVSVVGVAKKNTSVAMVQMTKESLAVVSNVSAQEISRTQDSNAGEVIRRVPGVSLIEDKFVMVRGLSQRYNNVWINGGAAPSSEADSRAFSFDLIPSSQIDNMQVVKTPMPEYPADYTGGFITINTKEIPTENSAEVQVGGSWNTHTTLSDFSYAKTSGTDFLGFDNGLRSLSGGIDRQMTMLQGKAISLADNSLNNDWGIRNRNALPDFKLAASLGRRWYVGDSSMGMIAAVNYSNEYRTYDNMENNFFGVYKTNSDESNYLHHFMDNQYNHNVRVGAMLNFTLLSPSGKHKYQFKNIFNQIGNDRYTYREGYNAQSDNENSSEYYYRSRMTYNTQLTGKHTLGNNELDWSASYSFANRNIPDRRRLTLNDKNTPGTIELTANNDLQREWTKLNEHIMSVAVNDKHDFTFGSWTPTLKAGLYGEYRTRKYNARKFIYENIVRNPNISIDNNDITSLLSNSNYYGTDGMYLNEEVDMRNNYKGNNKLGAAYVAAMLPVGKLNIYAGVRYEYDRMELIKNISRTQVSTSKDIYEYNDLFPSINTTYKINDEHQIRLSYGKTVNRPEFREVSPSVFYDFDLGGNVQGNSSLTPCYVQNVDLRYEFYPSRGEIISVAAFYKYFDSPIEWSYTVTGGTDPVYNYINAKNARNYGIEVDIRKDLGFIGLKNLSWSFNGAIIKSLVKFEEGSKDEDRPMQGQSPYIINTGLFYKNEQHALDIAVMYNRIGKRIIGVGRTEGTTLGNETLRVPNSYEMPRNVIDLSASKRFGEHFEVKVNVRDLLAEKVFYKQIEKVTYADGHQKEVKQVTRCYRPGRNIGISATYKF